MPRKVDTYEIEQKSIPIFTSIFPSCIKVQQIPDMDHIDYRVGIRQDMGPTGKNFAVQLKGQQKVEIEKGILKFRNFEVKHLEYYLDKVIDPVFIFVADTNNLRCYYLFLQKWLQDNIIDKDWQRQQTTTINIPIQNILKTEAEFIPIVISAIDYMRDLHPSLLRSAYKSFSSKIKEIDPKIKFKTLIENDTIMHILKPASNAKFEMIIPHEVIMKKYQQFIETGKTFNFNTNENTFSGTEIFRKPSDDCENGKSVLQKSPIELEILLNTSSKKSIFNIIHIKGQISWDSKYSTFNGVSLNELVSLSFKLQNSENFQIKDLTINFSLKQWEKTNLLNLSKFNEIYSLLNAFHKKDNVSLNCIFENNELFKGNINTKSAKSHFNILQTIELLWKCRKISKFYNINPTFKSFEQLKSNSRNIEIFYSIMKTGSYTENCDKYSVKLPINFLDGAQKKIETLYDTNNDFMLQSQSKEEIFFEESITIGELVHVYLNWKLVEIIEPEKSDEASRILIEGHTKSKLDIFVKPTK